VIERPLKESEWEELRRDSSFDFCGTDPVKFMQVTGGGTKDSSRGRESMT